MAAALGGRPWSFTRSEAHCDVQELLEPVEPEPLAEGKVVDCVFKQLLHGQPLLAQLPEDYPQEVLKPVD